MYKEYANMNIMSKRWNETLENHVSVYVNVTHNIQT